MEKVHVFWPSSNGYTKNFFKSRDQCKGFNLELACSNLPNPSPDWPYTAFDLKKRVEITQLALNDPSSKIVWCAKGGYGASEILDSIDWKALKKIPPKIVLGFSDACSLLSAIYSKLHWTCIHGPMPATESWHQLSQATLPSLLKFLSGQSNILHSKFKLSAIKNPSPLPVQGPLFGGCLSVLTNLIGSRFFPHQIPASVLLLEDLNESPPRLLRYWSQWKLSGYTDQLKAVIIGTLGEDSQKDFISTIHAMHQLTPKIAFYKTEDFGHHSPNHPFVLGRSICIEGDLATSQVEKNQNKHKETFL